MGEPVEIIPGVCTIRTIDSPAELEAIVEQMTGFRSHTVAGKLYVVPLDPEHPDYGYCVRKLERAKRKAGVE